ncbi:hypothetical protein LTS07_007840 [Exophiala sideris]|nr:hypothetical protein LTS07_007840 [Exophiala sideris]KAK5180527.1 hypothetical protein LTR44_006841 [Eurotiomycetes sp. CCFEE 6388]
MLHKVKKKHYQELVIIVETLLRGGTATAEFLLLALSANTKPAQAKDFDVDDGSIPCAKETIDPDGLARRLQSRCGGLVEVTRYSQDTKTDAGFVVQFLHQTVKEYFLERRSLESFLGFINYLAPGVDLPNGHFFMLRTCLEWLKMTPQARQGSSISLEGLPSSILYQAQMIESHLNRTPTDLLQALDSLMSQQSKEGLLWPVKAVEGQEVPLWLRRSKVAIQSGQLLLITATRFQLSHYISATLTVEMMRSICASGVTQFGYFPCALGFYERPPHLLVTANFLIDCGVDVSRLQTFNSRDPPISMDALRIFVSLHATCYYSDDETHDPVGHMAVLRRLLELSTDPSLWCVERTEAGGVPIRLAEHFLVNFGDNVRVLDLLWDQANTRSLSIADLFGRKPSQIFGLRNFQVRPAHETARWLFNHGQPSAQAVHHEARSVENSAAYLIPRLEAARTTKLNLNLLDVGTGSGSISVGFAKAIPEGRVIAVDLNEGILPRARLLAEEAGVTNIEFRKGDVFNLPFEDETFDITHCHQVLTHTKAPSDALREMLRVTKPGGFVAAREGDLDTECVWPALPALLKFHDLTVAFMKAAGGTGSAGRQLLSWALQAGVKREQVTASFSTWTYSTPQEKKIWANAMIEYLRGGRMRTEILAKGLAQEAEMDEMAEAWEDWITKEDAMLAMMQGEIIIQK